MIPKLHPIAAQVRALDARYWSLHLKCADGTATADDLAELDAMEAAKINSTREAGVANNAPATDQ